MVRRPVSEDPKSLEVVVGEFGGTRRSPRLVELKEKAETPPLPEKSKSASSQQASGSDKAMAKAKAKAKVGSKQPKSTAPVDTAAAAATATTRRLPPTPTRIPPSAVDPDSSDDSDAEPTLRSSRRLAARTAAKLAEARAAEEAKAASSSTAPRTRFAARLQPRTKATAKSPATPGRTAKASAAKASAAKASAVKASAAPAATQAKPKSAESTKLRAPKAAKNRRKLAKAKAQPTGTTIRSSTPQKAESAVSQPGKREAPKRRFAFVKPGAKRKLSPNKAMSLLWTQARAAISEVVSEAEGERKIKRRRPADSPKAHVLLSLHQAQASQAPAKALYQMVSSGSTTQVSAIIKQGVHPKSVLVMGGQNLMFLAASRLTGATEMCKLLYKHGVDASQQDSLMYQTPLYFAVRAGAPAGGAEAAEFLLSCKCDPNHEDMKCQGPLFYAVQRDEPSCAKVLLRAKADVNAESDSGQTPLFHARSANIVKLLIKSKADVDHKDQEGCTALFSAADIGEPTIIEALCLGGADLTCQDLRGNTALKYASSEDAIEVLREHGLEEEKGSPPKTKRKATAAKDDNAERVSTASKAAPKTTARDSRAASRTSTLHASKGDNAERVSTASKAAPKTSASTGSSAASRSSALHAAKGDNAERVSTASKAAPKMTASTGSSAASRNSEKLADEKRADKHRRFAAQRLKQFKARMQSGKLAAKTQRLSERPKVGSDKPGGKAKPEVSVSSSEARARRAEARHKDKTSAAKDDDVD